MNTSWKNSIYLQREQLGRLLHEPLAQLAAACTPHWHDRAALFCDSVGANGIVPDHFGRDRSQRPYMKEAVPAWGFLLSDAYISIRKHRPSLTALQLVRKDGQTLGYLGADFDLRNLPVTAELYEEPGYWRQVKGDPAIRGNVLAQCRAESPMDGNIAQALSILEELLTHRGVFQCQIHFSSSQATIWTMADPYRYRILDHEALSDPDICLVYPAQPYPPDATIPQDKIRPILNTLQALRLTDPHFYLRTASLNLFNGMVSLTFSCDGSHYMSYEEFLLKDVAFWF